MLKTYNVNENWNDMADILPGGACPPPPSEGPVLWHCLNHKLELAVGDTINEVHGMIHFQSFVGKLHSVYSVT